MFNEAVLEEFVKADPGINVPLMDKEHLVKPIQMKIVNGRVKKIKNTCSLNLKMINSSAFADRKCRHQQVGTSVDCQL